MDEVFWRRNRELRDRGDAYAGEPSTEPSTLRQGFAQPHSHTAQEATLDQMRVDALGMMATLERLSPNVSYDLTAAKAHAADLHDALCFSPTSLASQLINQFSGATHD